MKIDLLFALLLSLNQRVRFDQECVTLAFAECIERIC